MIVVKDGQFNVAFKSVGQPATPPLREPYVPYTDSSSKIAKGIVTNPLTTREKIDVAIKRVFYGAVAAGAVGALAYAIPQGIEDAKE